ncbi:MAG: anhydro-N-acetylmuramic acid kinase [Aureisphaera sp.]
MNKSHYKVIGVMSGTSLDGIDLAECNFEISGTGVWSFEIGKATTIAYSEIWKDKLKEAIHFSKGRLHSLNKEYTQFLGRLIGDFISENQLQNIDAVCSHGHTVLHRPDRGITLQVGNLKSITEQLDTKVVCDFRVQDVALGGQGAPLVPIGDRLLFPAYDYCLNLGGFANVSSELNNQRIAYDICPANIVLNPLAEQLGHDFDEGGKLAASGSLNDALFHELNRLAFYKEDPPKSLGLEWVQQHVFPLLNSSEISIEDKLHTVTEHIAFQLAQAFEEKRKVLVTGGGAYNTYLLERLGTQKDLDLVVPDNIIIEYKEALVFGLLGVLRLRNEVNCLASVTGALRDHCGGIVFMP